MRSEHADYFNHDEDAPGYDEDVRKESHPIRAGYQDCLDWVAAQLAAFIAERESDSGPHVVDLGAGTGNLTERLPVVERLTCVDVSQEMWTRAKAKLVDRTNVAFVQQDLLEFVSERARTARADGPDVEAVVSTYALHHLTEPEKQTFFGLLAELLSSHGLFVCGDLMFENGHSRVAYLGQCRATDQAGLADEIEDEFFWDLESAQRGLASTGFETNVQRFSDLSWGIAARLRR